MRPGTPQMAPFDAQRLRPLLTSDYLLSTFSFAVSHDDEDIFNRRKIDRRHDRRVTDQFEFFEFFDSADENARGENATDARGQDTLARFQISTLGKIIEAD